MNPNHPHFRKGVSLVVGFLLLFAGWIKLIHPTGIESILQHYSWVPLSMAKALGFILGIYETLLGIWLVSGRHFGWARKVAIGTFLMFLVVLITQFVGIAFGWGQVMVECPCYGPVFSANPTFMIMQDAVILLALFAIGPKPLSRYMSWKSVAVFTFLFGGFIWVSHTPQFDIFVVKARAGFQMDNLPSMDKNAPNQGKKRLVVVVKDPVYRMSMQEIAIAFPAYQPILIHADGPPLEAGPEWLSMKGNPRLMPLMFRSYPTVFLVENDHITNIWYGKLPVGD